MPVVTVCGGGGGGGSGADGADYNIQSKMTRLSEGETNVMGVCSLLLMVVVVEVMVVVQTT